MENSVLKVEAKSMKFHIIRELQEVESLMDELPDREVVKMLSSGGFSSIGIIKFVADRTFIKNMHISTLRVGKEHIISLDVMKEQERIGNVEFVIGSLMKQDKSEYKYFDVFSGVCEKNEWSYLINNNHSKLILMDTDRGKYVLETSSNLNNNPKIEHFSFEKSEELYDFYLKMFWWWKNEKR